MFHSGSLTSSFSSGDLIKLQDWEGRSSIRIYVQAFKGPPRACLKALAQETRAGNRKGSRTLKGRASPAFGLDRLRQGSTCSRGLHRYNP